MFDKISLLVKGSPENNTIAAFSFATRRYCSHKGSNGIMESHLHTVVPYGKSHTMQSTLPSGILFIPSRQSSLYILFSSIIVYKSFYCLLSEQRELCLLQLDALASLVVILLVKLKADEVAFLADGCNGGGATTHAVV